MSAVKVNFVATGFERQRLAVSTYARGHDIRVVEEFLERAVPGGTELEHRPVLVRMFEALAADGVKLVLIERLDRLARDLMIQESIIADLRKRGFELVSALEPDLLATDPSRVLMRQVFGAIAQYDKSMLVAKLGGARSRVRAREGRCEGRKPYGAREGEQATIQRMRELRAQGTALWRIAGQLNAEGVSTRTRGRWHAMAIQRILKRNP